MNAESMGILYKIVIALSITVIGVCGTWLTKFIISRKDGDTSVNRKIRSECKTKFDDLKVSVKGNDEQINLACKSSMSAERKSVEVENRLNSELSHIRSDMNKTWNRVDEGVKKIEVKVDRVVARFYRLLGHYEATTLNKKPGDSGEDL